MLGDDVNNTKGEDYYTEFCYSNPLLPFLSEFWETGFIKNWKKGEFG